MRIAICFLALALVPVVPAAEDFRVPFMKQAPVLDGQVKPAEWLNAVGFDGFAWQGKLERRKVRAFVGAAGDRLCLYLAVVSQLPEKGKLLTAVDRDTLKVVYDDSIEVWIDPTPGSEHGRTFQMIVNSDGRRGWKLHTRGNVPEDPGWRGSWRVANGFHDGKWHCEIAVPIAEIAPGRRADTGVWGINLCRNWKQPWQFSSLGGGAYAPGELRFTFAPDNVPAIRHEQRGDGFAGNIDSVLTLHNPGAAPLALRAVQRLERDIMPTIEVSRDVRLAPGEKQELELKTRDTSTQRFSLRLQIDSSDGKRTYYGRTCRWKRGAEDWRWTTTVKVRPTVDVQFAVYPYRDLVRVRVDTSGLPKDAEPDRAEVVVRPKGGSPLRSVRLDRFVNRRQEVRIPMPASLPDGTYEIAVHVFGRNVPDGEVVKSFVRKHFPWEHSPAGRSTRVYPPFTPLELQGKKVRAVLREHTMNDDGLWDQVIAESAQTGIARPVLAAPMHYTVTAQGKQYRSEPDPLRFTQVAGHRITAQGRWRAGPLSAQFKTTWDFDGTVRVDLTLLPTDGRTVDALILEVPFRDTAAPLIHAMGDGIRNTIYRRVPPGDGTVWSAKDVQVNDFPPGFCTYIYVGSPVRGICWFTDSERGWLRDRKRPNLELVRRNGVLTLRVHLVDRSSVLRSPRTLTFGLQAAPVKPRLSPWRHRWFRDKYTLLGTDINWFALGNCGAVYPAHKDMFLWEMLARGNREQLSGADIAKTIEHGRKYFEPYGKEYVERFIRHVRYNLRARYGKKMVFYYNRASYRAAPEFQVFQDEWGLTDFRSVGPGNSVSEIKIVPSESYIDHALYWYGKSFDIAGNRGVYWDNFFFAASWNTEMTYATRTPRGEILPSTGIWGLRELAKRTFQTMNERGMTPIVMAHMTSTSILPMLSFCTVQYDWEWKYSQGDVQYRFPREYILLVTDGELAGTWPVLLHDHGKLGDDVWTQRTFAGVCLVHELDPPANRWGKSYGAVWKPLLAPIHTLLDRSDLEVFRYWDERPQPVSSQDRELPGIVYLAPGREAVVVVTSYAEQEKAVTLTVDPEALGLQAGYTVTDVETDKSLAVNKDRVRFMLKKHDLRELRIRRKER
ncbi:MAG: hypothetical protein GXP31_13070 [Kiritimatiellaeota bacterium]|nr:hypothetical protein [Kiritimatiellota bacterium]